MTDELRLTQPVEWFQCWEWHCVERATASITCDHVIVALTCPTHAAVAAGIMRRYFGDREWTLAELRR